MKATFTVTFYSSNGKSYSLPSVGSLATAEEQVRDGMKLDPTCTASIMSREFEDDCTEKQLVSSFNYRNIDGTVTKSMF